MDITRRYFMRASGALAAYVGFNATPALGSLTTHAAAVTRPVTKGKTLVVVFLRGGADGLNLVVPHGDPAYAGLRPSLHVPAPDQTNPDAAIDLDGYFGLHPRLAPLAHRFASGEAVAAHAVGYAHNTRSHFEEQDVWETGIVGNTVSSDGWLNRHLATSTGHGPIRAVSIGGSLPRIMQGKAPAYAISGVEDLTMPTKRGDADQVAAALETAYCVEPQQAKQHAMDLLSRTAQTTLSGMNELRELIGDDYQPAADYPQTPLASHLREVARLVKNNVGLEVAEVSLNGWDTHQNQGAGQGGAFGNLVGTLAGATEAFMQDLGDKKSDVCLVTLTDFGRTARENGTAGTDHGWANALLAVGGPVAARAQKKPVLADWPGLAPDQLHQGRDLLHTTDFRDVIAEMVRKHLGNPHIESVLPTHNFKPVGLIA